RSQRHDVGIVRASQLLKPLESEARCEERRQKAVEWQMHPSDTCTNSFRPGHAWGRTVVAPGGTVARVKLGHTHAGEEERMGPDEARMSAEVDERRPGSKNTRDRLDRLRAVVEVDVRPDGEGSVEAIVDERKPIC